MEASLEVVSILRVQLELAYVIDAVSKILDGVGHPPATQDVALVVAEAVPAAEVQAALVAGAAAAAEGGGAAEGAGSLLEDARLFDVYTGEQAGPGRKSLAYTLRFRAPDRTLTDDEVAVSRDAAVAAAHERTGAVLRGSRAAPSAG